MPCLSLKITIGICGSLLCAFTAEVMAVPPNADRPRLAAPNGSVRARTLNPRPLNGRPTKAAVFDAQNVKLLSHVTVSQFGVGANDVWAYVSPQGREYAIVGLNEGTGFVDVTDPTSPASVDIVPDNPSGWSDMGTYQHYAYNVNESGGGMQVIDLSQIDLGVVTLIGAMTDSGLATAHNLFVNTESGFAYLCGANSPTPGILAVSLADPADPVLVGVWGDHSVHDLYVTSYDDCPYDGRIGPCEIAFAFGGQSGLTIVDVTDKSNMTTISNLRYPGLGFCHQGWPTEDRRFLVMGDEFDEGNFTLPTTTHIVNIQRLDDPQYVRSFTNGETSIDHNLMVRGDFVFEANYTSGLRIYRIADLSNIEEVGYFDTFPANNDRIFAGAWGVYSNLPSGIVLISDMTSGLYVVDVSDAVPCQLDSNCSDGNPCTLDTCEASGECTRTPLAAGSPCDDGDGCTVDGQCDVQAQCISTDINTIACSDDGPCAPGSCDVQAGHCVCFQCAGVAEPTIEAHMVATNRYLSFTPANPGMFTALRVTPVDLPDQHAEWIGVSTWVGHPKEYCENAAQTLASLGPCGPAPGQVSLTILAAPTDCEPAFRDWGFQGAVHVYGDPIVPGGEYIVEAINLGCFSAGLANFSPALPNNTSRWGDVVRDCTESPCGPPDGSVDLITDVVSIITKFSNLNGAPSKVRCDLEPERLDQQINFTDVVRCLGAFQGQPYPFVVGDPCN